MQIEGLIGIILLIGLPLFFEFFPRRPKYYYEDENKLNEDARIMYVVPCAEGASKQRRIRTLVIFDDGFEYSACIDSRTGLFTISASKEEQMEVVEKAIKKHNEVARRVMKKQESTMKNELPIEINLAEYEEIENISSLTREDKGKKIMVKGHIHYFYPTKEEAGSASIMQIGSRERRHSLEVEFSSLNELKKIFPGKNPNKMYIPQIINDRINTNDMSISTDEDCVLCGTLLESKRFPYIKLSNAIYYKK